MRDLIARAGEIVTCEEGHGIYRIVEDIRGSDPVQSSQFESIHPHARPPIPHELVTACECPECGSACFRVVWPGIWQVHLSSGWR